MLDQDIKFYLISLSLLITCLLDNVWILLGEVTCQSLLEVKGLIVKQVFLVRTLGNTWRIVRGICIPVLMLGCKGLNCSANIHVWIHLDVYLDPIHWPAPSWLVSSIGRALHRYRRGHGFKSRTGLNFFQVLFTTTRFSSVLSCEDLLISSLHRSANIWIFIYLKSSG